jgi:adenine-specific DNA-methyltransferase
MIKYIGSKRVLLPTILEAVRGLGDVHRVIDLFSGTARVGHALKKAGYAVTANDHNAFAHVLSRCYVQADRDRVGRDAERLVRELSSVPPRAGYFTETYCVRSKFFHPKNGERIDAMREAIAAKSLDPDVEAVLLTSLMEAADRVDSTTGVQMAYLKNWAPRALNDIELRVPGILSGGGRALCGDAIDAARTLSGDLAYLDPPYNQHSYLGNYHVWESLVLWDKPEVYGVACKRIQCKEYRSRFNSKRTIGAAFRELAGALRTKYILVSFSNEGFVRREEMEEILATRPRARDRNRLQTIRRGAHRNLQPRRREGGYGRPPDKQGVPLPRHPLRGRPDAPERSLPDAPRAPERVAVGTPVAQRRSANPCSFCPPQLAQHAGGRPKPAALFAERRRPPKESPGARSANGRPAPVH